MTGSDRKKAPTQHPAIHSLHLPSTVHRRTLRTLDALLRAKQMMALPKRRAPTRLDNTADAEQDRVSMLPQRDQRVRSPPAKKN